MPLCEGLGLDLCIAVRVGCQASSTHSCVGCHSLPCSLALLYCLGRVLLLCLLACCMAIASCCSLQHCCEGNKVAFQRPYAAWLCLNAHAGSPLPCSAPPCCTQYILAMLQRSTARMCFGESCLPPCNTPVVAPSLFCSGVQHAVCCCRALVLSDTLRPPPSSRALDSCSGVQHSVCGPDQGLQQRRPGGQEVGQADRQCDEVSWEGLRPTCVSRGMVRVRLC